MIQWFKKLFYIVKNFDKIESSIESSLADLYTRQTRVEYNVNDAVQTIKDRTTLHADVAAYRGTPNQIILIGRYRNRDYIQTFDVHHEDFSSLVRQCVEMQKYARMGTIDAVPQMKQIIESESQNYWGIP